PPFPSSCISTVFGDASPSWGSVPAIEIARGTAYRPLATRKMTVVWAGRAGGAGGAGGGGGAGRGWEGGASFARASLTSCRLSTSGTLVSAATVFRSVRYGLSAHSSLSSRITAAPVDRDRAIISRRFDSKFCGDTRVHGSIVL